MAYSDADRLLTVRGTLTYPDTGTQALTSAHISSFIVNEDAGRDVPVGAAPASSFELKLDNSSGQWEPGGSILGAHTLDGAKVEIEIGLWNGATYDYSDIGTYYVDDVQGQEHETLIRLKGSDAMVSLMSEYYADGAGDYPQTLGSLLTDVASVAGVTLESAVFTNSAVSIPAQPAWKNNLTCREAVGYIAACAGGIARFNRAGKLEIAPLEKVSSRAISTSVYKTIQKGDTSFGGLNAINVYAYGAPDGTSPSRYATTPATPDTSLNSINIKGNPILAHGSTALATLGAGMLSALTGLAFRGATFEWHGDPAVELGELCTVTDLSSTAIPILITKQTLRFASGFSMNSGCAVTTSTKADASGKLQKIFTPTGNLNAEALAGNIYVKAGEKMTLESGGDLNLLAGGNINIKNLGNTANVINMDNTGFTLSSTGQLKLQSTDSIIIGGSPFSVGGTNYLPNSDFSQGVDVGWGAGGALTGTHLFNGKKSLQLMSTTSYVYKGQVIPCPFNVGETFTVSVMVKTAYSSHYYANNGKTVLYARCSASDATPIRDRGASISSSWTSDWQKVSLTMEVPANTATILVRLYANDNAGTSSYLIFNNVQIEKGTMVTDWSPSPQDTVDALTGIGTSIGELQARVQVFYQTTKPTYTAVGDLWYDTDSNPLEVWKCTNVSTQAHTAFTDPVLTRALSAASSASSAAAAAQGTANSKINTFVGSSTPTALAAGDLWLDTGNKNIWKRATAAGTGGWVQYLTASGYLITTGITIDGTDLTVKATGNLNLAADGNLNVQNGGNLNVLNGGDIEINNGGDINVAAGGKINLTTSDDLMIGAQNIKAFAENIDLTANNSINLTVKSLGEGGTNLIPNSDFSYVGDAWHGWENYSSATLSTSTYSLDGVKRSGYVICPAGDTIAGAYIAIPYSATSSQTMTLSFFAFLTSSIISLHGTGSCGVIYQYDASMVELESARVSYYFSDFSGTSGWQRMTKTVSVLNTCKTIRIDFRLRSDGISENAVRVTNFQLERGAVATAWKPSPSDPASGVKTSYIDIATDHIDIGSSGNVSIAAGANFNVRAGAGKSGIGMSNNRSDDAFIWAGSDTPANAPFRVTMDGELTASSIGGGLVIPVANGGTGYNRQTIHRGSDYPSSGFGQDGDLFIFHNGQANASWSAQTLTYGTGGQNTYFGVSRNWNQVPTTGFYRFGNGVGSSAYDFGAYAYFTAPAAVNSLTFAFVTAKYYNSTWYGYSGTTTYKVALAKASVMSTILASATCYASQSQNTQTVTLTTAANMVQGDTYYIAVYFDGSDEKTNAGIVGSITMQAKYSSARTFDLLLKSAGNWHALFGNG